MGEGGGGQKSLYNTKKFVSLFYKSLCMDNNKEYLYKWFATHPLFSLNGMCKLVKIDTANFSRYLTNKKIPEKYIEKIEKVIKDYGYFKPLNTKK